MKIFICEERLNILFFDYCTKITVSFIFVNAVFDINRHCTYTSYMMAFNVMMKKACEVTGSTYDSFVKVSIQSSY